MSLQEDLLKTAKDEIFKRTRLNGLVDIVEKVNDEEIECSLLDSIDEINSFEPRSNYTIENILESDLRLKNILYLGASKNLVALLIFDYTANGINVDLGDGVSLDSRLGDYQSLLSTITDEFDKRLERFKISSSRIIKTGSFSTGSFRSLGGRYARYSKSYKL